MEMGKRRYLRTFVRRSCITGKIVWVYRGISHAAAMEAYKRARKKEIRRVRMWMQEVNKRRRGIGQFIAKCTESMPLTAEMTPEQMEAARELQRMEKDEYPCHREFYEHIVEEARRKNESSRRWRDHRNRWFGWKQ